METITKKCTKCGVEKDSSEFGRKAETKTGLSYSCRKCNSEIAKAWRKKNRARSIEISLKWQKANRKQVRATKSLWRASNKDKIAGYSKKYYQSSPEIFIKRARTNRLNNPDKVKEQNKLYRTKNPEKIKDMEKLYRAINLEKLRERERARVKKMPEEYVKKTLRITSIPITPETIKMKRLQLTIHRQIKDETN